MNTKTGKYIWISCFLTILSSIPLMAASDPLIASNNTGIGSINFSNHSISQIALASAPMNIPIKLEWQKCLGGSGDDVANCINQTADGGYIIAGYTNSNDRDVRGNHGSYDAWVVKINSTGSIQWQKCLDGDDSDKANSVQQTTDGGYIVAGETGSNDVNVSGNHGLLDAWVIKLNSTGATQWQNCLGGSSFDSANSIQQTSDGGYIVAGGTESNDGDVSGNHGSYDAWVVKLDSTGALQWQKCLGGSGRDIFTSIQQATDGGYVAAGYTESNNGNVSGNHGGGVYDDFWVVKLNSGGAMQWQKCLGGSADDFARSIEQTSDGGYIVAGETYSNNGNVTGNHGLYDDAWVVKLDSGGNMQWQKCLGGSSYDAANSIQQTTDGGYVVAGSSMSNDGNVTGNHGNNDFWIVKLSNTGSLLWQKCLGGSGDDEANSIHQAIDGGYIVAGYTDSNDGNVSGNHGSGIGPVFSSDFWVVKLKPNTPPNVPSIPSGPTSGFTGTSYNYSTSATDPEGDQVKYTFAWGDGTTNVTGLINSGTSASASHTWGKAGTYQVKANATDSHGATSGLSSPLTVTINTSTQAKLVGADDASCDGSAGSGNFHLCRFQAVSSGNVNTIRLKASGSGNAKVAIYADNSGSPGALLSAASGGTSVIAGWNNIGIPSISVTNGAYYWLAFDSDTSLVCLKASSGLVYWKPAPYSTFTFPSQAGSGFSQTSVYTGLIAGWSITPTQAKLVGADDASCDGSAGSGNFHLCRFQAVSSGTVNTIRLKASGSGNAKVAIYADNSGSPGALLSAASGGTSVIAGWNNIGIPSISVTNGAYYWLAFDSDTSLVCLKASSGLVYWKPAPYSTFTFPSQAGSGFSQTSAYTGLIAGWSITPTQAKLVEAKLVGADNDSCNSCAERKRTSTLQLNEPLHGLTGS